MLTKGCSHMDFKLSRRLIPVFGDDDCSAREAKSHCCLRFQQPSPFLTTAAATQPQDSRKIPGILVTLQDLCPSQPPTKSGNHNMGKKLSTRQNNAASFIILALCCSVGKTPLGKFFLKLNTQCHPSPNHFSSNTVTRGCF